MTKTYNKQKETYDVLYKNKVYEESLPDYKIVDNTDISGMQILVVGIGTGRDVTYLIKRNNLLGLDISPTAIKVAKSAGITAKVADLEKPLDLKSNQYDIVVAKDILEHLHNPEQLLKEMRRVVKKDGYIVISVPNHFYFGMRLRILLGKGIIWKSIGHDHHKLFKEWNYMHKTFFTWKSFKEFINIGGLEITRKFWDFGTLAHYTQPEMVINYLSHKGASNFVIFILSKSWTVFNIIFPRRLRSFIVGISPNLFCAGFYVWCRPK